MAGSQTSLAPSSATFDILPALHELLARIEHTNNGAADSDTDGDLGALYTAFPPLEAKDLPGEVLQIKAKVRKALRELEKLPDMERSVGEQREEMAELETRIAKQKEMIRKLGEMAKEVEGSLK